ncbi:MAG: adenine phosphoribosyltransferase [Candidatus Pacebacteria bacterium]|nr:adenine phosphoribosyltransferase [Candidatus Paceibacterota bacterium]
MTLKKLKSKIVSVPDWPKKGVVFRDITPVLEDKECFRFLIDSLVKAAGKQKIDKVVGIDARGFLLASALAYKLKAGLAIVRKKGKLPRNTVGESYDLEYASEILEMHRDGIKRGENILIVDDVLATGGTMAATVKIVRKLGGSISGLLFFIELDGLGGRKKLEGYDIRSLIKF